MVVDELLIGEQLSSVDMAGRTAEGTLEAQRDGRSPSRHAGKTPLAPTTAVLVPVISINIERELEAPGEGERMCSFSVGVPPGCAVLRPAPAAQRPLLEGPARLGTRSSLLSTLRNVMPICLPC